MKELKILFNFIVNLLTFRKYLWIEKFYNGMPMSHVTPDYPHKECFLCGEPMKQVTSRRIIGRLWIGLPICHNHYASPKFTSQKQIE